MKIIKNLKYDVEESVPTGVMVSGTTINVGPMPFIRNVQLSNVGVLVRRMDQIVFFPMDELIRVAEAVNEKLRPPQPPNPANQ